ncbi:type II secretion system F family protein [Kocuria sp. LUK]|uniref:type II secretion system F family protein n=1 Tax=Kocuria sp. LUK TaxID=2897828 RepID=UPI001E5AF1E3|nr:type II secretion system F family protein [Kocuria sp. LUK]MCD1146164.1 type II secretion system F family protein [Kocuria sp. LUK]
MAPLLTGFGLLVLAGLLGLFVVFRSRTPRLPMDRRRPPRGPREQEASQLSRLTGVTTEAVSEFLEERGWTRRIAAALENAGIKASPADFLVLVAAGAAAATAIGTIMGGFLLGLLFLLAAPIGAKAVVGFLTNRRKRIFADQLDNTLQLFSGSLRAGHSLLRAVDAVARESEAPTSEELTRIVNETRLGMDLDDSMSQVAKRMESEDFSWVAQAIGIHREVGGDLAEVLDRVAGTIRERNQIRRQVKTLSAEGKMSAYILMALPVLIAAVLSFTAPSYIALFISSGFLGFAMIGLALLMFAIGGFWMSRIIKITF